jgi:hypothetical protein
MRSRTLPTLAFSIVVLGTLVSSQAPGVTDGVKVGKVYVSGENPVIRLLEKESAPPQTQVSFWRIIYSPAGTGHVCFVTSDISGNGKSPDDVRAAFTDSEPLLDYLTKEILGTFDKTYVEDPFPRVKATFARGTGDTRREWKESLMSEKYKIELVWKDFYPPFQLDTPVGGARNPFGVTSLFIPAKDAEVSINGKKVVGRPFPQMRGPAQSSSTFLAFSETWIK